MSVRLYWHADDPTASTYNIEKSVDKGKTYAPLGSFAASTTGPNYDARTKRFFFDDAAGNAGNVYSVTAVGALGVSDPTIIIAPPEPVKTCLVVGYVRDLFGSVDQSVMIAISSFGTRDEVWAASEGIVGQAARGLGVKPSFRQVYVDENGMFQAELIRNCYAKITISDLQYELYFIVPNEPGPVNVRDIQALRSQELELFSEPKGGGGYLPES